MGTSKNYKFLRSAKVLNSYNFSNLLCLTLYSFCIKWRCRKIIASAISDIVIT